MSHLAEYLKESANTTSRESLIAHRALYDFKLAAARSGYDLRVFLPDVDRDGYDVVLEDGDTLFHVQFKATIKRSAPVTNVHKGLLRPPIHSCMEFGFERSPEGVGLGGGIVQCVIAERSGADLSVKYRYADVRTLLGYHWGLLKCPDRKDCDAIFHSLTTGSRSERIDIKSKFLVTPKDVDSLLGLMGLHSTSGSQWNHVMHSLGKATNGGGPRNATEVVSGRDAASEELLKLVQLSARRVTGKVR